MANKEKLEAILKKLNQEEFGQYSLTKLEKKTKDIEKYFSDSLGGLNANFEALGTSFKGIEKTISDKYKALEYAIDSKIGKHGEDTSKIIDDTANLLDTEIKKIATELSLFKTDTDTQKVELNIVIEKILKDIEDLFWFRTLNGSNNVQAVLNVSQSGSLKANNVNGINFIGATVTDKKDGTVDVTVASSGVQSVVAGTNISVDNTDPNNPIVSSTSTTPSLQAVTAVGATTTLASTFSGGITTTALGIFNTPGSPTINYQKSLQNTATGGSVWAFQFARRSGTTPVIISSGDYLGQFAFTGYDGANFIIGAQILGVSDGTPGTNVMPGKLLFLTTPTGSSTPTLALTLNSDQTATFSSNINSSGLNLTGQTASTIAIFDASKNVISADTSTYPSLTELSYVKGVTSAIQTQLNGKQASGTYVTGATNSSLTLTSTTLGINLANSNNFSTVQYINYTASGYFNPTSFGVGAPNAHPALAPNVEVIFSSRSASRKTFQISKLSGQTASLVQFTDEFGNAYFDQRANGDVSINSLLVGGNITLPGTNTYSFGTSAGSALFLRNASSGQYPIYCATPGDLTAFNHTNPQALIHGIKTTEQLRLGYDASNYWNATTGSTGGVTFDGVGTGSAFTFNKKVNNTLPQNLKGYTVATLPTGVTGDVAYCTDLLLPTYLGTAVGGGAVVGMVFYNGSNWIT